MGDRETEVQKGNSGTDDCLIEHDTIRLQIRIVPGGPALRRSAVPYIFCYSCIMHGRITIFFPCSFAFTVSPEYILRHEPPEHAHRYGDIREVDQQMTRKAEWDDTPADDTSLQPVNNTRSSEPDISFILSDLRDLIRAAKSRAATAVNVELVLLYWHIGDRIGRDILKEERAPYGKRILSTVSKELIAEYGPGYSLPNLTRMIRFAALFPSAEIVSTLSKQLSWSHFVELLQVEDAVAREFYVQLCRIERWSVRELHSKIQGMLFERTALSRKPEELARQELAVLREEDRVTPDLVFRDPYLLDFLGLADTYSERDLETAILRELERFLLELGAGFAFIARQKRIVIDGEDYYIDLLFYHRGLRRLVAIDLKIGKFQAADKGQMELYLRWLDRYERRPEEESPMGLILCAGKSAEHIELLQLDRSGIRVAEYLTELPSRAVLEERLKAAISVAREQLKVRYDVNAVKSPEAGEE